MLLRRYILTIFVCGLALLYSSRSDAQSFDCKMASTVVEEAICNDAAVSAVDLQLANAIKNLLHIHPDWRGKLLLAERHWLRYRDRECSGFAGDVGKMDDCLRDQYARRLAVVESADPLADPVADLAEANLGAHPLALDYRAGIRAALHGAVPPVIDRPSIAGINVPSAPASVDEIFDQCGALDEGLVRRLPEYARLRTSYAKLAAELTTDPADRESAERLQFTQCSWLRAVATRCLEPTSYYGANKSSIERLAQNIPVGSLYEDDEDDCMRELVVKRNADLEKLAAVDGARLAEEISRRIPPLTRFGIFIAPAPHACVAGDTQVWALDPHFDGWLDCSQTPEVLVIGTTLDDSISGVSVWLGTPMYHGDDHVFAGTATYQRGQNLLATSTEGVCPLELNVEPAGMSVRFRQSTDCDVPGASREFSGSEVRFRLVSVAGPTPDDSSPPTAQIEDFVSGTKPGRVWIMNGRDVTVAWVFGLNRSVQTSSDCYGLSAYDHLVQFFADYRTAIVSGNAGKVAALTAFPLQIDSGATEFVKNAEELKRQFTTVFPRPLIGVLRDLDPHFIYCQRGHVMVAAGRVWAKLEGGGLRVYFVDSHARPLAKPEAPRPN